MRTNRFALAAGLGALAIVGGIGAASAAPLTISSTVPQSGFNGPSTAIMPLTDPAMPYDFTGQGYNTLTSLDSMTVTLTLSNGDSVLGGANFDELTLALDGIDTGLKLNGFLGGNIQTLDITGATGAAILAALQSDGQLVGTILDASPNDGTVGIPGIMDTTLALTGQSTTGGGGGGQVPLPAAVLLAPLGAGLAGVVSRRMRRQ